ncbi:FHA domain-containing protein [Histoplasma capsulatum var. duboisii H88]|nr:FHA domain-containing protein [Histoplasma capsulatum var. duboisii H88]
MSSPATAARVPSPEPSSSCSRPSRLRRLSNLRAYTHSHLSGNSASSSHRSYRNSLTRAVGLSLHSAAPPALSATDTAPPIDTAAADATASGAATTTPTATTTTTTTTATAAATSTTATTTTASPTRSRPTRHPCPEPDPSRLSTNLSAQSESSSSSDHSHPPSSSVSSHSIPSNDLEPSEPGPASGMARHRNIVRMDVSGASQDQSQHPSPSPSASRNRSETTPEHSTGTTRNTTPGNMESPSRRAGATPLRSSPDLCLKSDPPKPAIRFYAYQDPHQNSRPSLPFTTTSRTLPNESSVIRVGRYSERDGIAVHNPTEPSDAPIGFKSKVVSRRHCEFSFVNGQWHIRDVGSSSGTFLNHMRLSQPNMASRLYAVRDGDILQLGIDFRGGEEMIFRCVRMRIECNRTWQQQANEFNKNTAALINNLGKGKNAADYAGSRECSICLGSVLRPYQCLFMAACAHVWHYKCIHRLIHTPEYPMFQCPNCRAYTDLSAEVDDSNDPFEDETYPEPLKSQDQPAQDSPDNTTAATTNPAAAKSTGERSASSPNGHNHHRQISEDHDNLAAAVDMMNLDETPLATPRAGNGVPRRTSSTANADLNNPDVGMANGIRNEAAGHGFGETIMRSSNIDIPQCLRPPDGRRPQRPRHGDNVGGGVGVGGNDMFEDTPLTPRNDFGPLAFDGRAGRL